MKARHILLKGVECILWKGVGCGWGILMEEGTLLPVVDRWILILSENCQSRGIGIGRS